MTLIAVFAFSIHVFKSLPEFGRPILSTAQYYIDNAGQQIRSANIVSAVVLDYRAYDTLGEVTVLATAILGVFTILRVRKAKKEGGEE